MKFKLELASDPKQSPTVQATEISYTMNKFASYVILS